MIYIPQIVARDSQWPFETRSHVAVRLDPKHRRVILEPYHGPEAPPETAGAEPRFSHGIALVGPVRLSGRPRKLHSEAALH